VRYALALARATRPVADGGMAEFAPLLRFGAGPRASQSLVLCGKARATLAGRPHVGLDDIRAVAAPVLRHRILPSYEADARGMSRDDIVARLLEAVQVPTSPMERDPAIAAALT
jgi:MoxR-like ATPase